MRPKFGAAYGLGVPSMVKSFLDHFVCADQRLCDVATLEGLTVLNPELIPYP